MSTTSRRLLEVFITFLCCPSLTVTSGEFAVHDYLGQAMAPYSGGMCCPAQLLLQQHDHMAAAFRLPEDLNVGDVVTPVYVEDCAAETSLIEADRGRGWCR